MKSYRWSSFWKARIQNRPPFWQNRELHMLCWGDTPVGAGRRLLYTWKPPALRPKEMGLHYVQQTSAKSRHPWLRCFTIKTSEDPLQIHCPVLRTRRQTYFRNHMFSEEIFFTFYRLFMKLTNLYFYHAPSSQIYGWLLSSFWPLNNNAFEEFSNILSLLFITWTS